MRRCWARKWWQVAWFTHEDRSYAKSVELEKELSRPRSSEDQPEDQRGLSLPRPGWAARMRVRGHVSLETLQQRTMDVYGGKPDYREETRRSADSPLACVRTALIYRAIPLIYLPPRTVQAFSYHRRDELCRAQFIIRAGGASSRACLYLCSTFFLSFCFLWLILFYFILLYFFFRRKTRRERCTHQRRFLS